MRIKLILCFLAGLYCFAFQAQSQSVSINTDGTIADTSAMLDIKSVAKGLLIPRMTKTQRSNIYQPATGLLIYQTGPDSSGFHYYSGAEWIWLASLNASGILSVGVSLGITGGTISAPVSLSPYKSYLGLSPTGGNDYYELPDPATCPGRIYYIRNNNNPGGDYVNIRSAGAGLMCNGNGGCLGAGAYYALTTGTPNPAPKTIMVISDGVNWTIGLLN